MTALWESDLRLYLASPLLIIGLLGTLSGCRGIWSALRLPPLSVDKNVRLMSAFRLAIAGMAIACIAAGWLWQVEPLALTAAVIGAGEMLETSLDVWALRRERGAREHTPG